MTPSDGVLCLTPSDGVRRMKLHAIVIRDEKLGLSMMSYKCKIIFYSHLKLLIQ